VDDPGPARAALLLELRRALAHPRSWWRALTRAPMPLGVRRSLESEQARDAEGGAPLDIRLPR
jgi:hypothetical protein